jgi:DnaK suppressor protein
MKRAEIERFKRILEVALAEMQEHSQPFEEIAVEDAPDAMDRIQQAYQRDLTIRQMESAFSRLQDIRLALERISSGTYGACLRCEHDIRPERLHAIPWAGYCVRCQDIADRTRRSPAGDSSEVLVRTP